MKLVSSTATYINSFSLPKFFSPINVIVPSGIRNNRDNNIIIIRQQKTKFGVMGGTPLCNRCDRRFHSVTKSLNLSPQRWIGQIVDRYKSKSMRSKSLTLQGTTS